MTADVDNFSRGLTSETVGASRYSEQALDPGDASGMQFDLVRPGQRVLDVGCGAGFLGAALVGRKGCDYLGIEPNEARAAEAAARGLDVRVGFFDEAAADEIGDFDVVLFSDVLEHLPDPYAALALARRVLAPGGRVILSTPNVGFWSIRLELLRGRFDYAEEGLMDSTHLRWFTRRTIELLVKSAGYRVLTADVTRGVGYKAYRKHRPFRWIIHRYPNRYARMVRWLVARRPLLFGLQHILSATPTDPPTDAPAPPP